MTLLLEGTQVVPPEVQKYFEEIGDLANFDIGEPTQLLAEFGDYKSWAAFASASLIEAWNSLPPQVRQAVRQALFDAYEQIVAASGGLPPTQFQEALGGLAGMTEMLGVIGMLLEAAVDLVDGLVKVGKAVDHVNLVQAIYDRNVQQQRVFQSASDPFYQIVPNRNYIHYRNAVPHWHARPCISPPTRQETEMFGMRPGMKAKGNCNRRMRKEWDIGEIFNEIDEPMGAFAGFKPVGPGPYCKSEVAFSSIFFPFWSPNHPSVPVTWVQPKEAFEAMHKIGQWDLGKLLKFAPPGVDPNRTLVARQSALLADAKTNLSADGKRLRKLHDAFKDWYLPRVLMGVYGTKGDQRVDESKGPYDIDLVEDKGKHVVASGPEFYFGKNGLIRSYGDRDDLAKFGVVGPKGRPEICMTLANYNTVRSMTMAFFTARASMLQNAVAVEALLDAYGAKAFDPEVRPVMTAMAKQGEPQRMTKKGKATVVELESMVAIPPDFVLKAYPVKKAPKEGFWQEHGAKVGVAAAAAAGGLYLARKRKWL